MATSAVEIANSALAKIGAQRIISLDDANERARLMKEQYDKVRRELLYSHPWNFAIARVELALHIDAPLFDWASKFQLPTNCLRVVGTDMPPDLNWHVEGGMIFCDSETLFIKYIKDESNTTLFTPTFDEALASKLASDVAYSLVQSVTLRNDLRQEAKEKIAYARSFDAQEAVGDRVYADSWLNSRA